MIQPATDRAPTSCRHAQCDGATERCDIADVAWAERARLLVIARRRTASLAEAEDVVSEALTRALESPDIDPERVAAWLTAVTVRLCVDHARESARAPKRSHYAVRTYPRSDEFEADVIDTLSAAEIAPLLDGMPPEQRRALQLRADGQPIAAIATAMSLTEKAAESLLGRARLAARSIVAGLGSTAVTAWMALRESEPGAAPIAISTAMVFAVTTFAAAPFESPNLGGGAARGALAQPVELIGEPSPASVPASLVRVHPIASHTLPAQRSRSGTSSVRPAHEVSVGAVRFRDNGSGRVDPDESLQESIVACLTQGIEIGPTYIGCRSGRPH